MQLQAVSKTWRTSALILALVVAFTSMGAAQKYQQTNLVSDIPGVAPVTDPNLVNPWGLISSSTSPWWVSDNNAAASTLYNGITGLPATRKVNGQIVPFVVGIPDPTGNLAGTPTGIVFSAAAPFKFSSNGTQATAIFSFVAEDGTISAWTGGINAVTVVDNSVNPTPDSGAVYKGATIAKIGTASFLYVTNFRAGRIEVYDTNFKPVSLDQDGDKDQDGAFRDHEIPPGFAPFNVQEVNGDLYVTYAKQNAAKHDDFDSPGLGFVDKFSPSGELLQRLERGPWLNAPWGVALAPANFGFFGNHLLIGNAGSGQIATYDAATGRFDGLLRDQNGHAIENDRLWALRFGNGANAGPTNVLFFTAGLFDESHGLFGKITAADNATPETGRDDQ